MFSETVTELTVGTDFIMTWLRNFSTDDWFNCTIVFVKNILANIWGVGIEAKISIYKKKKTMNADIYGGIHFSNWKIKLEGRNHNYRRNIVEI